MKNALILLLLSLFLFGCTKLESNETQLAGKGRTTYDYDPTSIEFTAPVQTPTVDRTTSPTTTFIFSYKLHVGTYPFKKYRPDNIGSIEVAVLNPTPTNCCLTVLKTRSIPNGWPMGDYTFTDTIILPRVGYYNDQTAGDSHLDSNYVWDGVVLTAYSSLTNGFADRNLYVGTPK